MTKVLPEKITMKMNSNLKEQIEKQNNLLANGPEGLIDYLTNSIILYDSSYFVKRILFRICKEKGQDIFTSANNISDISDEVYKDEIYKIIDDNNRLSDGIRLFEKTYTLTSVKRIIREDIFEGRTKVTREKIFVLSLALNLDYEQTVEFLEKGAGERDFNYRNPYEVLLAYCLIDHTNVYERYCNLKNLYENKKESYAKRTNIATSTFKREFDEIKNEDELVDFVCQLPNDKSKSALRVFQSLYNKLVEIYNNEKLSDTINKHALYSDDEGFVNLIALILKDDVINDDNNKYAKITKELFGPKIDKKNTTFQFIKDGYAMTPNDMKKIYNGEKEVRKSNILILGFLLYIKDGSWGQVMKSILSSNNSLITIFEDFSEMINSNYLVKAGFNEFYIPNHFETFIMRCLLTENPIETFKVVMMYEKDEKI